MPLGQAASRTTKRRRIDEITSMFSTTELAEALKESLKNEGRSEEAAVTGSILKDTYKAPEKYSPIEGLALIVNSNLTKETWKNLRYLLTVLYYIKQQITNI